MKSSVKRKSPHAPAIALFEDAYVHELAPLSLLRPSFDIKTGVFTLREKIERQFGVKISQTYIRGYLDPRREMDVDLDADAADNFDSPTLFINGRVLCDKAFVRACKSLALNTALVSQDQVLAMYLDAETAAQHEDYLREQLIDVEYSPDLGLIPCNARIIRHPWDVIRYHDEELKNDVQTLFSKKTPVSQPACTGVTTLKKSNIRIGKNTRIYPSVVLNAEQGEIVIGNDCAIYPYAYIEGPCFIGDHVIVKPHASIRNASIGMQSRVAGEVHSTLFHSFVNKQHEGFAGHSYFAPWVNIGAGTITSNLKNNYGTITQPIGRTPPKKAQKKIDTGMQFLGTIAGDHVKFGINTMLNTGTIVGVCCNIFGGDYPPKNIPSFQWGGAQGFETFDIDKMVALARLTMARRNEVFSPSDERVLRTVYDHAVGARAAAV